MTIERRLVVPIRDIKAVIFECSVCGARTVQPLGPDVVLPRTCPREHRWEMFTGQNAGYGPEGKLTRTLGELAALGTAAPNGFRVLLELEEPSGDAS